MFDCYGRNTRQFGKKLGPHRDSVCPCQRMDNGKARNEASCLNDKRLITAVFVVTKDGYFVPPQIIYKGKTSQYLPMTKFPSGWDITYTKNHWANEETTIQYISNVLLPYVERKRHELHLSSKFVIYDKFKAQCTDSVIKVLQENKIHILMVPPSCTDRLLPLDVSVNKAVKEFLRTKFQKWYAAQICCQLDEKQAADETVDLALSIVKPLGAKWLIEMYDYFLQKPEVIMVF